MIEKSLAGLANLERGFAEDAYSALKQALLEQSL